MRDLFKTSLSLVVAILVHILVWFIVLPYVLAGAVALIGYTMTFAQALGISVLLYLFKHLMLD